MDVHRLERGVGLDAGAGGTAHAARLAPAAVHVGCEVAVHVHLAAIEPVGHLDSALDVAREDRGVEPVAGAVGAAHRSVLVAEGERGPHRTDTPPPPTPPPPPP